MILFMEIFGMLLVVVILYILINYIYNNVLNVSDKRVALDHLPVPIYFGLAGKYPLVVNDKMYDLIYSIKNKPLTDMDKDFECLVEDHLKTDEIRDALDDEYKNGFFVNRLGLPSRLSDTFIFSAYFFSYRFQFTAAS